MKKLILICILFFASMTMGCATWNTNDKTLLASYGALSAYDAIQDTEINDHDTMDTISAIGTKAILLGGVWYIADRDPKLRSKLLWFVNGVQATTVGIKLSREW